MSVDGPVVAHDRGWGLGPTSGMDALVGGDLEYQGRCLLLSGNVVVWPGGTEWDAEREVVRLGDDEASVRVGDSVSGGGGMAAEEPDSVETWKRNESGQVLAHCLTSGAAVVEFNADADLKVTGHH